MKAPLLKLLPKAAPPPQPLSRARLKQIVGGVPKEGRVLDLGSGKRRLGVGVVHLDMAPHPGVDISGTQFFITQPAT